MMPRYIEADALIKEAEKECNQDGSYGYMDTKSIVDLINATPTADVAEVRHGKWEVVDEEEPRRYGCSRCKHLSWTVDNYCSNCGADMRGGCSYDVKPVMAQTDTKKGEQEEC